MEKKMNNKGFSLVELIIVVAIMAVLIGVLAPAYLQYVEKSKKTSDCTAIGSVMDALEIVASDPAITWGTGDSFTVTITPTANAVYTPSNATNLADAKTTLEGIVAPADVKLTSSWTKVEFKATKKTNGTVEFTNCTVTGGTATNHTEFNSISKPLANRFE